MGDAVIFRWFAKSRYDLDISGFRSFLAGSLTRNSSVDLTDFKTRSDKKKVLDAMAAASIFCNSAGVDTSKSRVIPLDALLHFLDHFQRENCGEDGAKQLIEVILLRLMAKIII